jgi:alanine racemase
VPDVNEIRARSSKRSVMSSVSRPSIELPDALRRRLLRPTWVEVDLDAIEHNVKTVKRWIGDVRLIGVLKGDGCGFGAAECGLAMQAAGVDMLAVGSAFEVPRLRRRGVTCPILLYASFTPSAIADILTLGAIPTIVDRVFADALAEAARALPKPVEVFVKIDTGLGRLGVPYDEAAALIERVVKTASLRLVGLYSHCGGADARRASEQLERMQHVIARARALGVEAPFNVLAATPHLMSRPDMWLTAVDPGRLLFGIAPRERSARVEGELRPALRALRSSLIQVKRTSSSDPDEYGSRHAGGVRRYGVLPFGWTDVLLREPYESSGALLRDTPVRFIAPLSAEHAVVDLTAMPDARDGDIVTILGRDGERAIDIDRAAAAAGVQVSDITRRLHRHLPFVYFRLGVPVRVATPLEEIDSPFT